MATQTDKDGTIIPETDDVGGATHAAAYFQITVTATAASLATLIGAAIPSWAALAAGQSLNLGNATGAISETDTFGSSLDVVKAISLGTATT